MGGRRRITRRNGRETVGIHSPVLLCGPVVRLPGDHLGGTGWRACGGLECGVLLLASPYALPKGMESVCTGRCRREDPDPVGLHGAECGVGLDMWRG